jgi:hypothetical protein
VGRETSDEHYVLDLCDEILGLKASRQHTFEWLLGDPSPTSGRRRMLPVDGFYERLGLVIEFAERQHTEPVKLFDAKPTISGMPRGEQRRVYDERRRELIPDHGLQLVQITASDFVVRRHKILRDHENDIAVVHQALNHIVGVRDLFSRPSVFED